MRHLCLVMLFVVGCSAPRWGDGDVSVEWDVYFGNDNLSRLNFLQTQVINDLGVRVDALEARFDPNDPNS